ncbi:Pimeloyl-ACP methyl ester carboxylesterase [Halorientalis persicus]|jgi:pimeloyl-ACP methyl ester carboxylesterase|uniref:Pimeloyl-ACP methyl ester carboxylesterase n=1 Tax=Halorientalis persicus TaxID=1367881 RepID=A0A1H8T5R3_9EURY|nr:alpha/beta hydrolase [Halorientalis persicus]SEO86271.1 Pimeloyl-ACP methyl ester carboxylesterase [Halorientalis persicus]
MGLRDALGEWLGSDDERVRIPADDGSDALALAREIAENPRTIELRDGRELGYAAVGDPDGEPLLLFHGFPNSRVFAAAFDEVAREQGVRVIAPERPGVGVSDPDPDRTLTDWPADVADLADALDLDGFPVLGISAGGPYAAATAALLDQRVERAGIVCGLGPMAAVGLRDRLWYYSARVLPPAAKLGLWLAGRQALNDRDAFLESMAENAAPADGPVWTGELGTVVHASMVESRRHHGLDPLVTETALFGQSWGFDLGAISVPTWLWYGKADTVVPPAMGYYLADAIPTAESHFYPDLGHLSTVAETEREVFETLST